MFDLQLRQTDDVSDRFSRRVRPLQTSGAPREEPRRPLHEMSSSSLRARRGRGGLYGGAAVLHGDGRRRVRHDRKRDAQTQQRWDGGMLRGLRSEMRDETFHSAFPFLSGDLDISVVSKYIMHRKKVYPSLEGRIKIYNSASGQLTPLVSLVSLVSLGLLWTLCGIWGWRQPGNTRGQKTWRMNWPVDVNLQELSWKSSNFYPET